MIVVTTSKEIEILRNSTVNYQFDRIVFIGLASPLLLVLSFVTIHLVDVFQIYSFFSILLITFYMLLLIPIYKISKSKINKQNRDLENLREMIIVDYKTCKFCGKQLTVKEFYNYNKNEDLQKLSKIWNSEFYGLLCCKCFENTPSNFWIKFKAF
ncbi:MAG: hypothetical protein ACXAB8_18705, partial [Promethearchaeota archaeon]